MGYDRFILPTSEIVRRFDEYAELFGFYEDSVHGLVRDTVLLSTGISSGSECDRTSRHSLQSEGLLEAVVAKYEQSIEQRYWENTLSGGYAAALVEMVVQYVDLAVGMMLVEYFHTQVFDICKTRWQWVGADLLVHIHFLEIG